MKKIISLLLLLCMILTLCVSFSACNMETVSPYTQLRDHLNTLEGEQIMLLDEASAMRVILKREYLEGNEDVAPEEHISVTADVIISKTQMIRVAFNIEDGSETYFVNYKFMKVATNEAEMSADARVNAHAYTGNDLIVFTDVADIHPSYEFGHRQNLTAIMNSVLMAMDEFLGTLDLSVTDLGFENLSDKYLSTPQNGGVVEEDLGGIFSAERFAYAGQMLLLGIGMVFLVLAILWMVLIIFAKTMGGAEKPAKTEKPAKKEAKPAPTPVPTPAPVASVTPVAPVAAPASDDAIVAAITAAIAMTIASDPALSSQFQSGFRVVSFQKKSGKNAWNR